MDLPKFKVSKALNGKFYITRQIRKQSFFRKEKWISVSSYEGLYEAYGYFSFEGALEDLLKGIKYDVIENSDL